MDIFREGPYPAYHGVEGSDCDLRMEESEMTFGGKAFDK